MRSRLRLLSIAAVCIVILSASFAIASIHSSAHFKRLNMTPLSPRLEQIFAQTKTVCFGRFVIDVPATATVVFGRMTVDSEIDRYPGEAGMADRHIAERITKIDQDEFFNKDMNTPGSLYRHVLDGAIAGQKTVVGANNDAYQIYSYVPVGTDLFLFEVGSMRETEEVRQEIASIESIARQLRARADDEVPAEPGICLDGGFINMNPEFENISMGIRLAEFPDVHLSIETLKNRESVAEYERLETRLKAAEREAGQDGLTALYSSIKFFRRAPRKIGDWDGEEALARMPAEKGKGESHHQFLFYAVGAKNDIMRPVADVQLDTGADGYETGARPPSLSDEEAVALWDKLTGSIRGRPTAPSAKTSDNGPQPLGTHASAGQACPQGGWWNCGNEGSGIETTGGSREYFRPGERMPQAVLFQRPTLGQRFKREQPTFKSDIPSVWTLVAYDQSTLDKIAASSAATANSSPPNSPASDAPAGENLI
jgi:hypothetical protein